MIEGLPPGFPESHLAPYCGGRDFHLVPADGGANNRAYRVMVGERPRLLLKHYFARPGDNRPRLSSEFAFLEYAWSAGIRTIPQPLAAFPEHHVALYEHLSGRHLRAGEITRDHVLGAMTFFQQLNAPSRRPQGWNLPVASEACFSVGDHLRMAEGRLERVLSIPVNDDVSQQARQWVESALQPRGRGILAAINRQLDSAPGTREAFLPESLRCVSPSDFGFHNALCDPENGVRFIDFEYAGWDDPAKTICDFFCQPAVPVPSSLWQECQELMRAVVDDDNFFDRSSCLLPLYRIKWCCIMLNEFTEMGQKRRLFSRRGPITEDMLQARLKAAESYFHEHLSH
ncbi:MAG: aminoglycoside phosphotransferase family protein [Verrucomicrobiae bacterium]|nr:aminoglycoside phosphotransferase family protein [Verrucomicrobiae bacterium]